MLTEKIHSPRPEPRDLYVIIPAAGIGSRMHMSDSKQFLEICSIPVLARTLLAFEDFRKRLDLPLHVVIVTGVENIGRVRELSDKYGISFVEAIVPGGATRQDSVAAGVEALQSLPRAPEASDIIFIHDGARCMVDFATLQACYSGGKAYDVCVAATPCKNTIKFAAQKDEGTVHFEEEQDLLEAQNPVETQNFVGSDSLEEEHPLVQETPDRSRLYEVQTPQVFKYSVLVDVAARAKEAGITATDDTALAEALGIAVHLIPCSYSNIKITTPEDAALAEFMLQRGSGK